MLSNANFYFTQGAYVPDHFIKAILALHLEMFKIQKVSYLYTHILKPALINFLKIGRIERGESVQFQLS